MADRPEDLGLPIDRMGALHTGDSRANVYRWIARAIDAKRRGDDAFLATHHYPGIDAGTEGARWLEACVRSVDAGATRVDLDAPNGTDPAEQRVNAGHFS